MKQIEVKFKDGSVEVKDVSTWADPILDDGSLTIDDRPEYDYEKALSALERITQLAGKARLKLFEADQMISTMDRWDAFGVLSVNELWELAERASYVDDMIDRKVEDLSKEVTA